MWFEECDQAAKASCVGHPCAIAHKAGVCNTACPTLSALEADCSGWPAPCNYGHVTEVWCSSEDEERIGKSYMLECPSPAPQTCTFDGVAGDTCYNSECTASLHRSRYLYDWSSRLFCDQLPPANTCLPGDWSTLTRVDYLAGAPRMERLYYRNTYTHPQELALSYDPGTNRLTTADRAPGRSITYAHDSRGRRTLEFEYGLSKRPPKDVPKHLDKELAVRWYGYSHDGRLGVTAGSVPYQFSYNNKWDKGYGNYEAWHQYDQRGLRMSKTMYTADSLAKKMSLSAKDTWFYFYDPDGRLVTEFHYHEHATYEERVYDYVYLEGQPVLQVRSTSSGKLELSLLANHLGQPVVGLSEDQQGGCRVLYRADVDAFGWTAPMGEEGVHQPLRISGQYEDAETRAAILDPNTVDDKDTESSMYVLRPALHYNWHRYYDPMLGQYISPDPSGQRGDVNPYRYVRHDPVNLFDPNGQDPLTGALIGAEVGAKLGSFGGPKGALIGALIGAAGGALLAGDDDEADDEAEAKPTAAQRPWYIPPWAPCHLRGEVENKKQCPGPGGPFRGVSEIIVSKTCVYLCLGVPPTGYEWVKVEIRPDQDCDDEI